MACIVPDCRRTKLTGSRVCRFHLSNIDIDLRRRILRAENRLQRHSTTHNHRIVSVLWAAAILDVWNTLIVKPLERFGGGTNKVIVSELLNSKDDMETDHG